MSRRRTSRRVSSSSSSPTWGVAAARYHAGLEDEERRQNQEDFVYDRARVMVATNAFGMGIDKSGPPGPPRSSPAATPAGIRRVLQLGLDKLPTYGALADTDPRTGRSYSFQHFRHPFLFYYIYCKKSAQRQSFSTSCLSDQVIFFPADVTWVLMYFSHLPFGFPLLSFSCPLCQKFLNNLSGKRIRGRRFFPAWAIVLLAACFHRTALIMLPLCLLLALPPTKLHYGLAALAAGAAYVLMDPLISLAVSIVPKYQHYLRGSRPGPLRSEGPSAHGAGSARRARRRLRAGPAGRTWRRRWTAAPK